MPLKDHFGQKLARDVMYYHNRIIQRFEKNGYSRQSCRLPDSSIRGVVFRIRISPRIRSQNQNSSKCSVRDLGQSDLCSISSLPCSLSSLPCSLSSLPCSICSLCCSLFSLHCSLCSLYCSLSTVSSLPCSLCSLYCSLSSLSCSLSSLPCSICSLFIRSALFIKTGNKLEHR